MTSNKTQTFLLPFGWKGAVVGVVVGVPLFIYLLNRHIEKEMKDFPFGRKRIKRPLGRHRFLAR